MNEVYVIGVDYGTDSVRSIIVNAPNGDEVAASVFCLSKMEKAGKYIENNITASVKQELIKA